MFGIVNKLVNKYKIAGKNILFQRTAGGNG